MIFIGCVLYDIGFKKLKFEKDLLLVILGRFAVSAAFMARFVRALWHRRAGAQRIFNAGDPCPP